MPQDQLYLIQGLNHSFAQRLYDGQWIVIGASDVLPQAESDELAYCIDQDFATITKLPFDTPIYASVGSFDTYAQDTDTLMKGQTFLSSVTQNFETVGDLFKYAQDAIRDVYDNLTDQEQAHFRTNNMFSPEAIISVADSMWDNASWASLATEADEIANDISDCLANGEYDAYPELLKEWYFNEKINRKPFNHAAKQTFNHF